LNSTTPEKAKNGKQCKGEERNNPFDTPPLKPLNKKRRPKEAGTPSLLRYNMGRSIPIPDENIQKLKGERSNSNA
jgi:hypothetical protein